MLVFVIVISKLLKLHALESHVHFTSLFTSVEKERWMSYDDDDDNTDDDYNNDDYH